MTAMCEDCPPVGYPTDETRCTPCPRRNQELCPHGHRISDNTCGPCSKGRPMKMHVDYEWSKRQLDKPDEGDEP